jgi:imidazolonepropionase-like amidohydrolase
MVRLVVLVLSTSLAAPSAGESACERRPLVFAGVAVPGGDEVLADRDVVVEGDRILGVGPAGTIARPAGAAVVDGAGHTLLPGLVDAHAHFFELGGGSTEEQLFPRPEETLRFTAGRLLASGVTTARLHLHDLEVMPPFARQSWDDCTPAPRLVQSGPGLMGGSPELNDTQTWNVRDAADGVAKVRRIQAAGGRWIALHDVDRFRPGEAEAVVAAARAARLRVMASGSYVLEIERAVALGVDTLEYLDRGAGAYPPALIARLRGSGIALAPPIGYYHRYAAWRRRDPAAADLAPFRPLLPRTVFDRLADSLKRARRGPTPRWASGARFEEVRAAFQRLWSAGLSMVVGTDAGSTTQFHHDAIWWELETWRGLGVPPLAALQAATVRAASVLGDPEIGRVAPGMRADLVLYRGDVRQGALAAERVRMVVKGGVVFVRDGRWVER